MHFDALLNHSFPNFILMIIGVVFLIKGADYLVMGAGSFARKCGISSLVVGLTIVAFGTSAPELFVNLSSSLTGANGITLGNVIGSNIANILLGIGIIALIKRVHIGQSTAWKEIPFLLLATFLMWSSSSDHILDSTPTDIISRSEGVMLLGFFLLFLVYTFGISKSTETDEHDVVIYSVPKSIVFFVFGVTALAVGGNIVVSAATKIALNFGLSESLIGITLVALGTSVPDIITTVIAARKQYVALAVGNIVGSNIFNILLVLGTSSVVYPIPVESGLQFDLLFTLAITLFLFIVFHIPLQKSDSSKNLGIGRVEGSILVSLYVAYMVFLMYRG